ncbi:MAG TPA: S8 family serine peptidase [Streptosporangiaceae bacterium]|nr:S8 family serine peptidase [Streptosporangiaceae bacterium]
MNDRVIVILKSQPTAVRPGTRAAAIRSALIANSQAPLLRELRLSHATHLRTYRLVNALAATVSAAEAANLRSDPSVAEVVPDVLIQGGSPEALASSSGPSAKHPQRQGSPAIHVIPHACGSNGQALLDPEALQATHTASLDPNAATARSLGFTGAGVRVAYIADGLDPHNVNFIRPDGRSVFNRSFGGDYQDFSGDGPGQETDGREAFLDANSIAGQGLHVYNVRDFSAQRYPSACNIRIEGMAPGASVVGLDVFGTFNVAVESNFLQAINYAVETDHVNVLNESFGNYPFPDSALNVFKQFNDAAIAAGTTVTTSTGDSGPTNTIGSPASDPKVISVGASTTFRVYAQTNYSAARYFASTGWLNDNVSAISSSGFTAAGNTISLVAPGDIAFASCSTNNLVYVGCMSLAGNPSPVELGGGTSESAPLTAGAAALVIQAYRLSHAGSTPSPALVKQILTSTATDLGLPATEQGAGLINSYKAVLLAESIKTSAGAPAPTGDTLLLSRGHLSATGWPGSKKSWQIRVTNTGARGQLVTARTRTFGADHEVQTGSVKLDDSTSPEFTDAEGLTDNYALFHFTVRPSMARLTASIAYQGVPGDFPVRLVLVDPNGKLAAVSFPQGIGNFGSVEVRAPVRGVWTGVVTSQASFDDGVNGKVPWRVATQRFTGFGDVQPRTFFLQPGQSRMLHVTETLPASAGDAAGSIVIGSNLSGSDPSVGAERGSIPVTLRSMIDIGDGGAFGGVLTGGNGRAPGVGQVGDFEFHVGPGHRSITANVSLANDAANNVGAYLIAPDGQALGFGQNEGLSSTSLSLSAYTLNPVPGTWTLVIDFMGPVVGNEVADHFFGHIRFDSTRATARGLPDSPKRLLKRGTKLTVPVKITNNGKQPELYFIDARLAKKTTIVLDSLDGQSFVLPLETQPTWFVPTEASSVRVTAQASLPVEFDWGPAQGDPDLFAPPMKGNQAAGTFTPAGGTVQPGNWVANPDEIGPYPHGNKQGLVTMAMTVTAKAFDPAVTTDVGDLWLTSINIDTPFSGQTINAGKSGVIDVTIKPSGKPGTVVRGFLYVDDTVVTLPPYGGTTGNELVAIPYAYTIK